MSSVRLLLTAADPGLAGTPLLVTTHPPAGRGGRSLVARIQHPLSVAVAEPYCGFAVHLPGGRTITAAVAPGKRDETVDLVVDVVGDAHTVFTTAGTQQWGRFTDSGYPGCWVRLWRADDRTGAWQVVSWPDAPITAEPDRITFHLRLPPGRHMVQAGGERLTPKLSVLPEAARVDITLRPAAGPVPWLGVFVTTDDLPAEALRGYLASGAVAAARQIDQLTSDAAGPLARIAAGYLSLRAGAPPDAEAVDGSTADETVIRAWRHWHTGSEPEAVPAEFERAVRAGVPIYPEGLRLLAAALRRLSDPGALDEVAPLLDAAELSEPTTAFAGAAPDRPSADATDSMCTALPHRVALAPHVGEPREGVHLPAATLADIAEAEELLGDLEVLASWYHTAKGWEQVGVALRQMRQALLTDDLDQFQDSLVALEVLGPVRHHHGPRTVSPMPAEIRVLVDELRGMLAAMRVDGSPRLA
ncbi:hypothetical protein BJY16_005122 [Actinoplanes octamycinicus]|uniref:CATRA-Associated Small Protein domain-containing protein n=1 Tax=Actinoplanes octamycinicus TaxID=135948 RepID=A0A7W7M952_9ACTN|nr:CATRA system-associated protein [Actinoplanes octamycinicus]MBB4741663.1 hypothetical protein [Actinoplanes octamycinicus]GIE57216.1 hypothetical protein Aoc01nite_26180 [Actinoplanes octamycinicus]